MFKTLFEVGAWRAACANASSNVKALVKTFKEVEDHLAEGLRFYMSLQDAVKQHQQQCSDYAYTRALQRDDLQQVRRLRHQCEIEPSAMMNAAFLGGWGIVCSKREDHFCWL